ncbi:MAG TPA: glycosyltransferase family 2 protein [Anaerolineales bacterium]|nr:glycosyltransferase family 2 protein [Anaerolineales bacterium]
MSPRKSKTSIDLVIPVFNEAGVVDQTYTSLCDVIDRIPHKFTIYYVDDGSKDDTVETLKSLAKKDKRIKILELSRNFGHQAALTAGIDASQGDFVISLDADGQHPPDMIGQMIELFEQDYDIVQAQRIDEDRFVSFKQLTSSAFYRLINRISGTRVEPGAADFRGLSRQAVDALKAMPEFHRFLRGMISWIGYKSVILPYHEPKRIAGRSKYSFGKMFRLAMDAIFSFSLVPLYIGLSVGVGFIILAIVQNSYVLYLWLTQQTDKIVPGWSSLMAILLIASGIIMILLGFIGVYIGYIFQEVKRRPHYLLKDEDK